MKVDLNIFFVWLWLILLVAASVFGQSPTKNKKTGSKPSSPQTISARTDRTGQHPGTAAIRGPATITCTSASSDIPNPQPRPSCFVIAPGFTGDVQVNSRVGSSGAGTVTLNCNGQGNILTCSASIQESTSQQSKKTK